MISRIAHVCLNVKSLDRSVEYFKKLGFTTKFKFTRDGKLFGAYLEIASGNYIELFENRELGAIVNNGLAHFCLESSDLDALTEKLKLQGVPFTVKKLGCDNTFQIWLTDPDGNSFEIHQYTKQSSQITGIDVEADW